MKNEELKITLEVKNETKRLDLVLLEVLQQKNTLISRAVLKSWFQDGLVFFAGVPAKASLLLPLGTHSITLLRENLEIQTRAFSSKKGSFLPIIYEDEDFLILNKTSGIPSAPHDPSETETAVGSALAHFPGLETIGRSGLEPGLLHRLDTGTSGLLAFAKSQKEYERLREAWQKRFVQKFYRALITPTAEAPVPKPPCTIRFSLAHDAKSAKKMVSIQNASPSSTAQKIRGKPIPAVTHLLSLRFPKGHFFDFKVTDFEIQIETGVMHQIRCHLSSMGWPIVGDPLYKGRPSHRLWLHAWKLKLPLKNGKELLVEAPLPEGWP